MSPRRMVSAIAALILSISTMAAVGGTATATENTSGVQQSQPPQAPASSADTSQWQDWAERDYAYAREFDWAAESAARGCEILELQIIKDIDAAYNAEIGAPADLQTVRVERTERCDDPVPHGFAAVGQHEASLDAARVPVGNRCAAATGPGTVCIARSGGVITGSYRYDGNASPRGFVRIGTIAATATSCPIGTTWLTGPTQNWVKGVTRSVSRTHLAAGTFSVYAWRVASQGNVNWGNTCARFG